MDALDLLRGLQLALFVTLGVLAMVLAVRRRNRPSTYLAAAFVVLAAVLLVSRLIDVDGGIAQRLQPAVVTTGLLAFPWLLASMAWAFRGPLPTWLRAYAAVLVANGLFVAIVDPTGDEASALRVIYVATFVTLWTAPSVATAARLWRARGRQTLVRQRLQLMAVGLLLLNAALLVAGLGVGGNVRFVAELTVALSILAALAFIAGFAPPLPLRVWWRRRSTQQFARMQQALIRAATPADVAQAVAPMLAELVGGGVAVVRRDGEVEAASNVDDAKLASDRARLMSGEKLANAQVVEVDAYWLVVQMTPYTPVFGQGERELVDSFAIQLRLALERAELFQAHLEARAEAEAASQELETTLMGLSHDLKSPTAAIAGFAAMLEDASSAEERDVLVEQIHTSTRYLEDLVDALLEFSKVGRTQVEVEPVDLNATLNSVVRRISANAKGLIVDVTGRLPVVLANPVRMEQVFDNLLGNAVKHGGREDLRVGVETREGESEVTIVVRDNGRGLDPRDAERIFALFTRGAGASRSGSGVGLGMVRRIIESYGGYITASSGPGACFEITLPKAVVIDASRSRDHDTDGSVAGRPAKH